MDAAIMQLQRHGCGIHAVRLRYGWCHDFRNRLLGLQDAPRRTCDPATWRQNGIKADFPPFAEAAAHGFAHGILSPTEILVIGPGVARQTAALARLKHELATQPGVAEIAGPATLPQSAAQFNPTQFNPTQFNPMLA